MVVEWGPGVVGRRRVRGTVSMAGERVGGSVRGWVIRLIKSGS